ncbi:hypothetical protein AJ79_03626 [Helicocarpus griseus UAMH5409]|uniref:HTH APSES-type domain-containing protein n=1 Tax=Helicocarpus griseus UAMH5409 TaxID=1447875 RepID=A0A2B7XWC2_9EURO|nr:hypothetical protein AJ79_03626 [Helicocarpus griseus UAMH5409]
MTSIASLLNPEPEKQERYCRQLPTPCPSRFAREYRQSPPPRQKKQKISKDAAVFTRGRIRGELRYPPCEYQNQELEEAHRELQIHPMGHITEYPRHIPYNSEKKSFLEKTGRESFEVFQYTFKVPGDEKTYTVMWDYNIGLVRTTSLFRCNNYSKTAPAKMLNANPGLRDICHSITGGALAAQGYWMPFEAAKAVAATFCWKIRYALTPLFGVEFLSICIPPEDHLFGRMVIDQSIVLEATKSARHYRMLEERKNGSGGSGSNTHARKALAEPRAPLPASPARWSRKQLQPKTTYALGMAGGEGHGEGDGGYIADTDSSDTYFLSPSKPRGVICAPASTPRTTDVGAGRATMIPSPQQILASLTHLQKKRATLANVHGIDIARNVERDVDMSADTASEPQSQDSVLTESMPRAQRTQLQDGSYRNTDVESDADGDADADAYIERETIVYRGRGRKCSLPSDNDMPTKESNRSCEQEKAKRRSSPLPLTNDARAAYMLIGLRVQDSMSVEERKRRRAST